MPVATTRSIGFEGASEWLAKTKTPRKPTADAEYIFGHFESRSAEWVKFDEGKGTWGVQDSILIINNSNGNKVQLPFRFADGKLIINSNGTEASLEKTE